MQQTVLSRTHVDMPCARAALLARRPAAARQIAGYVALFLLLCVFWGLIVYVAVSSALP